MIQFFLYGEEFLNHCVSENPNGFVLNIAGRSLFFFSDGDWPRVFSTADYLSLYPMIDDFFGIVVGHGFVEPLLDYKKSHIPKLLSGTVREKEHFEISLEESIKAIEGWNTNTSGKINLAGSMTSVENNFLHRLYISIACRSMIAPEFLSYGKDFISTSLDFTNGVNAGFALPSIIHPIVLQKAKVAYKHLVGLLFDIQTKREGEYASAATSNSGDKDKEKLDMVGLIYTPGVTTKSIPVEKISGAVCSIVYAGSLSSRTTTQHCLHLLCLHPQEMHRVMEEMKAAIASTGGKYTVESAKQQPYLENCIQEALRLRTALIQARVATADFERNGYLVPKGAKVVMNPRSCHYDDKKWLNAASFIPDRFDKSSTASSTGNYMYHSFSSGRHACPGKRFGLLGVKTFVTYLLANYEVSFDNLKANPAYFNLRFGQ